MAPRRAEEIPVKRIAALGCKLPVRLPPGEILTDVTDNQWRLGHNIGYGGFGDIYLASNDLNVPVGHDAQYVIKIEPHSNGPLFVEMNFYIRVARKDMIDSWCKSQGKKKIGIPTYEGSGSHFYNGERYRFLVIPRYGIDVGKLFISNGRKLTTKLVNSLAVQMLDALEYIHSRGYAHADVKGSNILLTSHTEDIGKKKPQAYLVDYGLAYRFRTRAGNHKPFVHDERRAHEGTLEYTSRDAHHGIHSRRSDLETLGYNLIQWLCGKLPWEKDDGGMDLSADPEDVQAQKENLFSDISQFMRKCFFHKKKPPTSIVEYMKYISELGFETKPNYSYLRSLFQDGNNLRTRSYLQHFNIAETDENLLCAKTFKTPYLRERRPCKPVNGEIRVTRNTQPTLKKAKTEFSWEAVLARHPDKFAKIIRQPPPPVPLTPPLTPPPSPPPPSLPTYAMLRVLKRMKEKQSGAFRHKTLSKTADSELKAKWMTPAMEEIAQLKKRVEETTHCTSNSPGSGVVRLTRSRVAQLKRIGNQKSVKRNHKNSINERTSQRKRKTSAS